jgi:hypothetical protein
VKSKKDLSGTVRDLSKKTRRWIIEHRFELLLFCLYSLAAILITFPLILKMKSSMYGLPGDPSGYIWYLWWQKMAWLKGLPPNNITLIGAPFGVDWSVVPVMPVVNYPAFILTVLTNEILSYNLVLLASFPIAGMTMYYLVKHVTNDKKAAAIAGLIYGFCPYHLAHSLGHIYIAVSTQWLPLLVLTLIKLKQRKTIGTAIAFGVTFALVTLTNSYDALFMAVFTACFALYIVIDQIVKDREKWFRKLLQPISLLALGSIVSVLIVIPFSLNIFKTASSASATYSRGIAELNVWSARPWDYILPSPTNPFFGKFVSPFVLSHLHGSNLAEQTLYLGYVTMTLAFIGFLIYFVQGKRNKRRRELSYLTGFLGIMAVVAFIASGPAFIEVRGRRVFSVSSVIHSVLPMFRVYARFGIVVMLCVTVLAGLGLSYILGRIRKRETRIVLLVGLTILIAVEFINTPPPPITDYSKTPTVYAWLKKQPGDFIIAEYPLNQPLNTEFYEYQFWQRLHQKRLFNGSPRETKGEAYRVLAADVTDIQSASVLEHLGVKYAIVHLDKYGAERPKSINKGFHLIRRFNRDTVLYSIDVPTPDTLVLRINGFSEPEKWADGRSWVYIGNTAKISIESLTKDQRTVSMHATAASFSKPRTLRLIHNGVIIRTVRIPETNREIIVTGITIRSGYNDFTLEAVPGGQTLDSVAHNGDFRYMSIAFSDLRIQ